MRFLLRQTGRLLGSLLLLLLAIMVGARAFADGYTCVRYIGQQTLGDGLVDVRTGARFGVANPANTGGVATISELSPDGKTMFYEETTSVMADEFGSALTMNLSLMTLPGAGHYTLRHNLPVAQFSWSPDSQAIAYTWLNEEMTHSYLALTNLAHGTLEVKVPDLRDIMLTGFSPDGRYLVTTNQGGTPRIVIVWQPDWSAHRLTEVMRHEYTIDYNLMYQGAYGAQSAAASVWWSPDSHTLALISFSEQDNAVTMLDVTTKTTHTYPLDSIPYLSALNWSPDSQYLAVSSVFGVPPATSYRLDMIGKDGRTQSRIGTGYGMDIQKGRWTAHNHRFYYFEGDEAKNEAELVSFDVDTGDVQTVLSSVHAGYVTFFPNDWICVADTKKNPQLIDLTGNHESIWLDRQMGCTIPVRAKDDKLWIASVAESEAQFSPTAWKWLRFDPLTMGDLPLTNFRYIGWSADARSLLYATSEDFNIINSATLSLLDTTTWQSQEVIKGVVPGGYLSPDNKWLFAQRIVDGKGTVIMAATDGSQMHEQPLSSTWPILTGPVFWSPDSHAVTYVYNETTAVQVVDMIGTDGTLLHRFRDLPDFADFPRSPANTVWTDCSATLP